jgi:hypothetical protein
MEPRSRLGQSGRAWWVAAVGYCLGIQRYIVGMVLIWRQGSRTKYVGVWYRVFFA